LKPQWRHQRNQHCPIIPRDLKVMTHYLINEDERLQHSLG
jgi:hypothetical protein